MSVAQILEQMGANAARARLQRGSIVGDAIGAISQIPGQVMDERARHALLARQQAQQDAQATYARNADARATKDQAIQDAANAVAIKDQADWRTIGAAMYKPDGSHDYAAAVAKAQEIGRADLLKTLEDHEREANKPTQLDPTKDTYVGGKLTTPAIAKVMTPAEEAQRTETARHNRALEANTALTTGRAAAAEKETERHNRAMEKSSDPFGGQPAGGATGEDLLAKMPADQRAQSQALVDGRRSLDARLASTPYGRTIIAGAYAIDPTFDQGNYNARAKARTDLTSPNGTGGKTIGALNTAIQHAGKLSDLIETLDNYETPLANAIVNPLRTAAGSTKVTNFDTVAPQLAKEIERVWRGAGGTAGEIHDLIETIGHNKGKQQQREALQQFVELAKGKLDTLERQRDSVLGPAAGASIPILFKENQPIVDTIAQRASGKTSAASGAAPAPAEGQAGTVNGVPAVWKTVNGKAGWYAK